MFKSAKELDRKTRWIRLLISIALSLLSIYGSYVIWWQETTIEMALQTPEGREVLAEALIEASKKQEGR